MRIATLKATADMTAQIAANAFVLDGLGGTATATNPETGVPFLTVAIIEDPSDEEMALVDELNEAMKKRGGMEIGASIEPDGRVSRAYVDIEPPQAA